MTDEKTTEMVEQKQNTEKSVSVADLVAELEAKNALIEKLRGIEKSQSKRLDKYEQIVSAEIKDLSVGMPDDLLASLNNIDKATQIEVLKNIKKLTNNNPQQQEKEEVEVEQKHITNFPSPARATNDVFDGEKDWRKQLALLKNSGYQVNSVGSE